MNSEKISEEKVLNPTVVQLGLVSFFADIASEMLYPITPIFLTTVLGASMTSVGFIEGFAEGLGSLLKTFSASWSDKILKRKPFILGGYFLSAVGKPLMGFATSAVHIVFARGLDRVGKGIRGAPRDALLTESVAGKNRGAAFGWHRAMDTAGAAIGPILAVIYLHFYNENLRSIYYWALIPGLLSVLCVVLVREPARKKITSEKKSMQFFIWKSLPINFKKFVLTWGLFSLVNSSDVFLLLKAKQQGLDMITIIFMYCFYNLFYSLLSPYFGKLSDTWSRKNIIVLGLFIFTFVYVGFSYANLPWHFWTLFGIYGIYMATTDGVGKAYAVDLIEKEFPELKATSLGVLGTFTGLATIASSTVAGFLWQHSGPAWTFMYGAAGAFACALILIFILPRTNRAPS